MLNVQRLKERHPNGPIIHVEGANGDDRTLCGYVYEGSAMKGEDDTSLEYVKRGLINCADCIGIIHHCELISRRYFARPGLRRSAFR